jgi:predicted amidohydrolase
MIIVQELWSPTDGLRLTALLQAAEAHLEASADATDRLALLPVADGLCSDEEAACLERLARIAAATRFAIAGAVRYAHGTIGFLIGQDGKLLVRAPKTLPDLAEGFSDTPSALHKPAPFEIARLPIGQCAVLVGEDATAPHLVRAAMWCGAEVVLNPAREFSDGQLGLRQQARMARAYENHLYVVTATPSTRRSAAGVIEQLPPASMSVDEWASPVRAVGAESFLRLSLDVESVRRRRSEFFGNLCISTRPTVYAPGYRERRPLYRDAVADAATPATRAAWSAEGRARAADFAAAYPRRPDTIERYDIVIGQLVVRNVTDAATADEVITRNVDHALEIVERFASAPDTRLVVFPEFFLQGSLMGRQPQLFGVAGIDLDASPHVERLARFAQQKRVFVSGAVLETDRSWPGYLFNTAFILDDSGTLIHRYRKIQCADLFGFLDTTPGSILDRYLERYGYEGLFPVANTRLGRLATAICFDMNFPELHRALAQRGAEVLLHPTAEPHNIRRRAWENSRQVRAWENTMYIASAGLGGEYWDGMSDRLTLSSRGHSKVVGFDGAVQSVADGPGALALAGQIDLRALREARRDAAHCMLLWDEPATYAHVYERTVTVPDNLMTGPDDRPYVGGRALKDVIARLTAEGVFVAPRASRSDAEEGLGTAGL